MFKQIYKIVTGIDPDIWLYATVVLLVVTFVVGLVLCLVTGDLAKFKKAAKIFLKDPNPKSATESAKKMPSKVTKLYKRAKSSGAKPSDIVSFDACIHAPYHKDYISKFTKTLLFATLILVPFIFGIMSMQMQLVRSSGDIRHPGYIIGGAVAVVAIVGLVLTLIAGLVSCLIYKGAVKTYDNYVEGLDNLFKGGAAVEMTQHEEADEPVSQTYRYNESNNQNDNVVINEEVTEYPATAHYIEPEVNEAPKSYNDYDAPSKLHVEIEEEDNGETYTRTETVTEVYEEVSQPIDNVRREIDEEIRREREAELQKQKFEQARQAALEKAKAQAEERKRAAQAEPVLSKPAYIIQDEEPAPAPAAPQTSASAEAVIARIELINKEGAPLTTMKEVALQLQQERAKPENKTPEMQKKLNEALSSLLKSMSNATKR